MIKVCVWLPTEGFKIDRLNFGRNSDDNLRDFHRGVGHASLQLDYEGKFWYLSFWPDDSAIRKTSVAYLANLLSSFKAKYQKFEQDVEVMGHYPDHIIEIKNLNNEAVHDFLASPKNYSDVYQIYKRNCSSVVLATLHVGAKDVKTTRAQDAYLFFTRATGVLNNIVIAGSAYRKLKENSTELQRPASNDPMALHGFDPAHMAFSLFEVFGGQTPNSVLQYADFLQKAVG